MTTRILVGDCRDLMAAMEPNSVDAIVCDPPYGLEFMDASWDKLIDKREQKDHKRPENRGQTASPFIAAKVTYQAGIEAQVWHETWAREALRVLKPGGYLLAFGGTRTSHRMVCAIEDAGFEVKDSILWLYASGFPKSHNISKAFDKAAGAEREVVVFGRKYQDEGGAKDRRWEGGTTNRNIAITAPATDLAKQWDGFGTALSPSHEPICMARKPLVGTVVQNVEAWGVGGINIDGNRIGTERRITKGMSTKIPSTSAFRDDAWIPKGVETTSSGRWPKNTILSCCGNDPHDADCPVAVLDAQSGECKSGGGDKHGRNASTFCTSTDWGSFKGTSSGGDSGGASRYFYIAKASKRDRGEGNTHPTVKPTALLRHLVRLVCPPGGTILDPFMGSGSTGVAAQREGFHFVGIEQSEEYAEIARRRLDGDAPLFAALEATR